MFENDNKVHILDHPLLQHKLSILRDERTGVKAVSYTHLTLPTIA